MSNVILSLHIDDGCLGGGGYNYGLATYPLADDWYKYEDWETNWNARNWYTQSYYEQFFQSIQKREGIFTYCLMGDYFSTVHLYEEYSGCPREKDIKYEPSSISLTERAFQISREKFVGKRCVENFIYQILQHSGPNPLEDEDTDFLNDWAEAFYGTDPKNDDGDKDGILDGHDKEPFKYNRRFAFIIEQDPDGNGRWEGGNDLCEPGHSVANSFYKSGFDQICLITNIDYKDDYKTDLEDNWDVIIRNAYSKDTEQVGGISLYGIKDTLKSAITDVESREGHGINSPPEGYGEDIIAAVVVGHGGKPSKQPEPVSWVIEWEYKTALGGYECTEHDVKGWIDLLGSGVRFVWLASCYSEAAFDRWNSADDCVVVGTAYSVIYYPKMLFDGVVYEYDDVDKEKREIMGLKNSHSIEFIKTFVLQKPCMQGEEEISIDDNYQGDLYLK